MRSSPPFLLLTLLVACGVPLPENKFEEGGEPTSASSASAAPPAAASIPIRFHGTFELSSAECSAPSIYRVVVTAREMRFHESLATVLEVEAEGEDAINVAADYQGEGESWTATQLLRLTGDGERLTLIGNGVETERIRCREQGARPAASEARWDHSASGEGDGLSLATSGTRALTLFCPAGRNELVVNVPAFRGIASEERMSFGSGGTAVTLVADPAGDPKRGGVTGRGPVPDELEEILRGSAGLAVNYGAQNSGPHSRPSAEIASTFAAGCRD